MKASFLSTLVAVVLASSASARGTTYFPQAPSTCASGQCPRISAAVTQVRSIVAEGLHIAGNRVAPSAPVLGVWSDPTAKPWHPPLPSTVPQQMAEPQKRQPLFPRLHHLVTGK